MLSTDSLRWQLQVDFASDGFGPDDDLSDALLGGDVSVGINQADWLVAPAGQPGQLSLSNLDGRFTPSNQESIYAGRLRPNLAVRLRAAHGGLWHTVFTGHSLTWETQGPRCTLICADLMGRLAQAPFALPLRFQVAGSALVRAALNAALKAPRAGGEIAFSGPLLPGDWVAINGTRYTFRASLLTPGDVLFSPDMETSADHLLAAINGDEGEGLFYAANTATPDAVEASIAPSTARLCRSAARYYRLGELSGPARDGGLNRRDATYIGGLWSPGVLPFDPDGARFFNGSGDHLAIPPIDVAGGPFTVAAWLKPSFASGGFHAWFGIGDQALPGAALALTQHNDGHLEGRIAPGVLSTLPGLAPDGQWSHVVYVQHGATATLYVNSLPAASGSITPLMPISGPITLGKAGLPLPTFNGVIDECALFNRALTSSEIVALYEARQVPTSLRLKAALPGAIGNTFPLEKSGANITISYPFLTGGSDLPSAPAANIEAANVAYPVAGDSFTDTAFDALLQITRSEQGLAWVARDGAFTWKNSDYLLRRAGDAPARTLSEEMNLIGSDGAIANRVTVRTRPRAVTDMRVIAQTREPLLIPGQIGTARFTPQAPILSTLGGQREIILPFTDPLSGRRSGAKDVILPLIPGLDWTANERPDGSGIDYTYFQALRFRVRLAGSAAHITVENRALGPLYVTKLQLRGRLITRHDALAFTAEDPPSQEMFGIHERFLSLPLPAPAAFAASLADYHLARWRQPAFRLNQATGGSPVAGGQSLLALEIGDVIAWEVPRFGFDGAKHLIAGIRYRFGARRLGAITFSLRRLDEQPYGIFDDATAGRFDQTARFGI
jgi:Concanavalin A-like lectin/glucanases superfamily